MNNPSALRPYDPREFMGTAEAAKLAGVCEYTVRIWCGQYLIGRKVAGRWRVSRAAFDRLLAGHNVVPDHAPIVGMAIDDSNSIPGSDF